jgi:hypothetical protein
MVCCANAQEQLYAFHAGARLSRYQQQGRYSEMNEFELSIDELEALCEKYDLMLSDPLIGLVSDVIVMVLNKENKNV